MNSITAKSVLRLNLLSIWRHETNVWGFRLTPPSLDRLACLFLHRLGLMGKAERAAFQRWIRPGMTVVDIGANQGLYSLLFSGLVGPTGSVLSFEPEPDMFDALTHNCRVNSASNVQCYEMAVGSDSRTGTLHRSLVHGGDNRIASGLAENVTKQVEIKIKALDEIVELRKVDFIKMDVQGWEQEAFRGMENVLANNPLLQIHFEFWPQGLRNAGANPSDVLAFLLDRDFHLSQIVDGREVPLGNNSLGRDWTGHRFTDIYARRPDSGLAAHSAL